MSDPDLIVRAGEKIKISARRHTYSNIHIESGGELFVPSRSRNFLLLIASRNVTINGLIVYRGCIATEGGRSVKLPNGEVAEFSHPRKSLGGYGGKGGIYGTTGRVRGGNGAAGTNAYGGGGGAGGLQVRGDVRHGEHGDEFRGGRSHSPAGDGGRLKAASHGGMICIFCPNGYLNGENGEIDLRGLEGENGKDAAQGRDQSGGGGGGAPGGDGGYLHVTAQKVLAEPDILLDPGDGRAPGKCGPFSNKATNGYRGDDGSHGWVDFF